MVLINDEEAKPSQLQVLFKPGQTDLNELNSSVLFALWTYTLLLCVFEAGEEWRRLTTTDKAPYELRAEEERRKYEQAMKEYNMVSAVSFRASYAVCFATSKMRYITSMF